MISAQVKRRQLIRKWPEKLNDVNRVFLPQAATIVEEEAVRRVPEDQGQLKSSIKQRVSGNKATVGTNLEYAPHVEYGTRPHFPPISAIKEWAGRVLGDNSDSTAFLIARKISRKGTKAQPYLRPALLNNKTNIMRLWRRAFRSVYGR